MKNNQNNRQPSEHNDRRIQHTQAMSQAVSTSEEQLLLDYLIDNGFVWEEAIKMIHMREHLYNNTEMQQRMADDARMQFARWLLEQGELTENI
ncbi:MAG TPA: hypothetical protein VKR83_01545 [Ktedonobacteraceae bacterium]|nr:hypothetical protein [Ktedonobacteraceae bacterium]